MKPYKRIFLHRKAIAEEYKRGAHVAELRAKFGCTTSDLKEIISLVIGDDEYERLAREHQQDGKRKKQTATPETEKKYFRAAKHATPKTLSIHSDDFTKICLKLKEAEK
jgi:hypothetical protein